MEFHGRVVLTSFLSIAVASFAMQSARAGDKPAPAPAEPAAEEKIELDKWGDIEIGGRYYIERPSNIGRAWVTPTIQRPDKDSIAKYEEYGEKPQGFYAERITVGAQTKDAEYAAELRATAAGTNAQRYIFDWSKTGAISGTVSWDQIPHLYSTTAQSIWGGVGTTYLTTPVVLGSAPTQAQINAAIKDNVKTIRLGIERDRLETDQRWTPTPNWEVRGTYLNERREGTQPSGVVWGGPGGPERIDVPRPIADTTQNAKASAERSGEWGYGKYNVKITGGISTFDNDYSSFTVQNPFASITSLNTSNYCSSTTVAGSPACGRISLMPSNQAYTGNVTSGIDLPWNTRWMNTVQYTSMRQDDPFIPSTITPLGSLTNPAGLAAIPGLPESSAHGEVDTLLVNSVLNTRITSDLKSTFRYRYYDNDNKTPEKIWNWVSEDYTLAADPRRNLDYSYTKQNASGDLNYHVTKNASVGGSAGWERIDREHREALQTNEFIGKAYGDARWEELGQFRASYQYSERRYDQYDTLAFQRYIYPTYDTTSLFVPSPLMRKLDLANRDRQKAQASFAFDNMPFLPNLTLTPTAGLRFDNYLTDTRLNTATNFPNEVGLTKDNSWNAGIEASYAFKPGTSIMLAYVRENSDRDLVGAQYLIDSKAQAPLAFLPPSFFKSNMNEDVDTFIVGANIALNDNFDFRTSYSIAFGKEDWTASAYGQSSQCPGTVTCAAIPTVYTNSQRVDAVLRYHFDSEVVTKLGFEGDLYWNLKYSWDHLRVDNWQNDLVTPYMYLVDSSNAGRNISMASYNPNYDIHVVATSFNIKW